MRLAALILAAAAAVVAGLGCEDSLGTCDMTAATAVVYTPDGVPYYEGQALIYQSCAGSFCHAAGANGVARYGAPHGANLDVTVLTATSVDHDRAVLQAGLAKIKHDPEGLFDRVESGQMPPGNAGQAAQLPIAWQRDLGAGMLGVASLPAVGSAQGQKLLRNWLACNAPVVAATTTYSNAAAATAIGAVLPAHGVVVTASFQSLYDNQLKPKCAACHNLAPSNPYAGQQQLDFGTADAAYASLVGKPAFASGKCSGKGTLVVAGNCQGSLLYQKLTTPAAMPVCGDAMPLGGAQLSSDVLAAVCTWINSGAAR